MVKPDIRVICSDISHSPLHYVWRDSGVTRQHGFELTIHVCELDLPGQPRLEMWDRAPLLLDGTYDFISGLHHEPYKYRARGDKRFVYLAQTQNDWDDRVIAAPEIRTAKDLEGQTFLVKETTPCVFGNLKQSLRVAGVDLDRVTFAFLDDVERAGRQIVQAVVERKAAAGSVDIPFDRQAEKRGLHRLDIPSVPVIHNTTICANREWVRSDVPTVLAYLRSMVDAIHFFKTQKSRVCEILERNLAPIIGLEGYDEIEHLQESWAHLLSPKPYPHPLAVWNVYKLDIAPNPQENFIGPFEIWDTSYLRTIDDEGYIDELYGALQDAANPPVNPVI